MTTLGKRRKGSLTDPQLLRIFDTRFEASFRGIKTRAKAEYFHRYG